VVASFGDDPTKIEVILPPGDPLVMLAEVATKPNFQLFGTAFLHFYPEDELAKRPAQPANTLIEIGVPYCFHVPVDTLIELKDDRAMSHLVFRKVWTGRAEGSSKADYRCLYGRAPIKGFAEAVAWPVTGHQAQRGGDLDQYPPLDSV